MEIYLIKSCVGLEVVLGSYSFFFNFYVDYTIASFLFRAIYQLTIQQLSNRFKVTVIVPLSQQVPEVTFIKTV